MSTSSLVALQVGDHFESIYIHFDGYLKGVGQSLLKYTTYEQVADLLEGGDRSSLDGDSCYGDSDVLRVHRDLDELLAESSVFDYVYVFMDGEWYYVTSNAPLLKLRGAC